MRIESKISLTFIQDSDCMQKDDFGQNLTISSETDGVADGHYFILQTDRWAFDNIDEMIELLKKFKQKYDLLEKNEP